jgi:hypothetical protein
MPLAGPREDIAKAELLKSSDVRERRVGGTVN